jgi:hypothetical protein
VETWGVSVASLVGGLLTLFVFRRGVPHVGWIVGYLILLWFLFTVLTEARQSLEAKGRRLIITAADYTIQTLSHGLLLFILPGYYASTTLTSVNAWFFLLLVGIVLLTTIDVWYRVVILPSSWGRHAVLFLSLFAALNIALPLVGIPPVLALLGSGGLSAVALTPSFRRRGIVSWNGAWLCAGVFAALVVTALWWLSAAIPPAPLHLARATLARSVKNLEPVDPVSHAVSVTDLRQSGGLVAYTAVYAPAGLRQPIAHVWTKEGVPVTTIPLSPVRGGRAEGFRTYSRKSDFRSDAAGRWAVDVVTGSGQLIGRLRFTITP